MQQQTYYLRFIAVNINKNVKLKSNKMNYGNSLLVKLLLRQNGRTLAEMPELTPSQTIQHTITLLNATIDVTLDHQNTLGNWEMIIMGRENSQLDNNKYQRVDLSQAESSGGKELKKIGQCQIDPFIYSQIFQENKKSKFQENVQISKQLSLDYEVYIHNSREELEYMIMRDKEGQQQPVDNAFKKRPGGSKKIRYVELNQNRQTSMNSSQFSISRKPQINALKKSGPKFIPIKKDNIEDIRDKGGKNRQYHTQRKIKPLPSRGGSNPDRARSSSMYGEPLLKSDSQGKKGRQSSGMKYAFWPTILTLLVLLALMAYMMFPRRRI